MNLRASRGTLPAPVDTAPRRWRLPTTLIATMVIAGCAAQPSQKPGLEAPADHWTGRLGLQVASEPPQSYSAGFELQGNAEAGELRLNSPLGNVLAVMQWRPGQAVLRQGEQSRSYASLDELSAAATGTPLPVGALFGWLHGQQQSIDGWDADLTRLDDGRLTARRLAPPPSAELRVILDR